MASELINKIKKLQNLVIKRNNEQFKKNSVEILNPEKADEDLFVAPASIYQDVVEEPKAEEIVEEPAEAVEETPSFTDMLKVESIIRKSIAEEQEAASVYLERARKCFENGQEKLAFLFEELASDEIVHAASLETALDMYGMFDPYKFLQGQAEAEYILQEGQDDIAKKEQKARDDAEKTKKDFDFVGEYTRDKAEYKKEQIVNAINDLILGKTAVDDVVNTVIKLAKGSKKDSKKEKKAE